MKNADMMRKDEFSLNTDDIGMPDTQAERGQERSGNPDMVYDAPGNRYELIFRNIHEYIYSVTYRNGEIVSTYHSEKSYEARDIPLKSITKTGTSGFLMIYPEDRDRVNNFLNRVLNQKEPETIEHRIIHKDGSLRWVSNTCATETDSNGNIVSLNGFVLNSTEEKNAEIRQKLAIQVLELLNRAGTERDVINEILLLIKQALGIEAAAIRLREMDDFPYYAAEGFPADFIEREKTILHNDATRGNARDDLGYSPLECLCGTVLTGKINRLSPFCTPFCTPFGSFWTNSMSELVASDRFGDFKLHPKDRCCLEGYESVALVPLKSENSTIGILQFNDHRKEIFSTDMIRFFEGIGASIAISHSKKLTQQALRESNQRYRRLFENNLAVMLLIEPQTGDILKANRTAQSCYGYSADEMIGMNISVINMQSINELMQELHSEQSFDRAHFITRHRLSSGEIRDVEVYASTIMAGSNTIIHEIIHVITDRKRAEESLLISEEQLRRRNEMIEEDLAIAQLVQNHFIPVNVDSGDRFIVDFRYYPLDTIGGDYLSLPRSTKAAWVFSSAMSSVTASRHRSFFHCSKPPRTASAGSTACGRVSISRS
jgi:PAS domain S-box-containing protein